MLEPNFLEGHTTPPGAAKAVASWWKARHGDYQSQNPEPHVNASEAGKCLRKTAYRIYGLAMWPAEVNFPSQVALEIGIHLHKVFQRAMAEQHPDFVAEIYVKSGDGDYLSGYADGLYTVFGKRTVFELKTVKPWMFGTAVRQGGPIYDNGLLQAMVYARMLNAEQVHIVYVNKMPQKGNEDTVAEWFIPVDRELVDAEMARMKETVELVKQGKLPARYHDRRLIEDPDKERWPCSWCPAKLYCVTQPTGETDMPLETLQELHRNGALPDAVDLDEIQQGLP